MCIPAEEPTRFPLNRPAHRRAPQASPLSSSISSASDVSMGDFRLRDLDPYRVEGTEDQFAIPLPTTPSGKIMRECPREECRPRLFQLGNAPTERTIPEERKVRRNPGEPGTTCPYCGVDDEDDAFTSEADVEHAQDLAKWAAVREVDRTMRGMARDFNRGQPRGGFLSVTMDVKGSGPTRPNPYREDLLRDLTCNVCQRRYGVYAIALYCPDCGSPNLLAHFDRELALIKAQADLARAQEETDSELAYRLLGNAHEDVLTAFETYLKTTYRHLVRKNPLPDAEKLASTVKNKFQNIDRARELLAPLGLDPFKTLGDDDLKFLARNIEKRHVIGHNLGMADEMYAEDEDEVGETVPLLADEVERFAALCRRVIEDLENSPHLATEGAADQGPPTA